MMISFRLRVKKFLLERIRSNDASRGDKTASKSEKNGNFDSAQDAKAIKNGKLAQNAHVETIGTENGQELNFHAMNATQPSKPLDQDWGQGHDASDRTSSGQAKDFKGHETHPLTTYTF
ncbi:hypothetical protein GOP47_0024376 [Adiantum capillus-veneris]|uniref:Uncharacterized protein n=1 Tax=Adiantum capillus-veneris TaxID=13818 RepID=A0A9D4U4E1_ADICA|nr:hypothetical protein GOP47_0024376 [Adiantum capillus-veneris]